MRPFVRLRVESLEPRDLPATFGIPWPDAERLTLSFAPDGTAVGGGSSSLSALGPDARRDALRAFQAWAVAANVNVGLTADDGSAFGVGGATQGDPRFGDVRVGGVPLPSDVLAVTAPYAPLDPYSGDVVINTAAFPGGPDLYTALLQEAGHALGVGNSPDPASAMFEFYRGPRAGLSAADVAAVQALYGPRAADRFEGRTENDTPGTATPYTGPLQADLTTAGDADVYRVTTGLLTRGVTVNLTAAGLSLLTAKVEVLDAGGTPVAALVATDPASNDITVSLGSVRRLATYYVRVSAAAPDPFAVGAYGLSVTQHSLVSDLTGLVSDVLEETGLNDTLATATTLLSSTATVAPRTEYVARGGFGSGQDVDVYRVTVPPATDAEPVNLLATVWGHAGAALDPWVEATDALGRRLPAEVLTANGNATTVQLRGVTPGHSYFLKLSSDSGHRGGYTLAADLRTGTVVMPTGATRTLTPTAGAAGGLTVRQSGQVHFVLTADAADAGQGVELRVTAADGTVVATLAAAADRTRSVAVFLPAGDYALAFVARGSAGPVSFRLGVVVRTDPIGATPIDSTGSPEPTSPPPPPAESPPPPPPPDPEPAEYQPQPYSQPGWDEPAVWY
jgi:hypothetical protein